MKITHGDVKSAYKSHIRGCVPPSREACPPAESIFSVFDESASAVNKEKIIDHVTRCCYCHQEFELFLELYRKEKKAVGDITAYLQTKGSRSDIPGQRRRALDILSVRRFKVRPLWRLAAGSLLAVSITFLVLIGIRSFIKAPEDRERGRLPGQIRLISPVQGKEAKTPLAFRWEGTPRADYYYLEIFDRSLLPLWKSPQLKGLDYGLPPEATDIIKTNEVYFWTVSARLIDGTTRESPLEKFIVRE